MTWRRRVVAECPKDTYEDANIGLSVGCFASLTQAATFTVISTDAAGPGSLRQTILDANATNADDTIAFTTTGTIAAHASLQFH
jgi:hypothetical protein